MRCAVFTASTPEDPPDETARRIAAAGYDGIEWRVVDQDPAPPGSGPGFWQGNRATWGVAEFVAAPERAADAAREAGLAISAIGGYAQHGDLETVDALLAATARIGVAQMRVCTRGLDELERTRYPELFELSRREMREVARRARHHGVRALIELHPGTLTSSPSAALRLLDGLDPADVGVIHDLGNLVVEGGEDTRAGIQALGDLLAHVHVKNSRPVRGEDGWSWEPSPIDEGVGDLDDLMVQLRAAGYDGWITLEDFCTELPLDRRLARNRAIVAEAWERAGRTEET